MHGDNYGCLVNFASKGIAIVAAAITSLDAITTVISFALNLTSGRGISRKCKSLPLGRNKSTVP
jgi:hypothetical protein